MNASVFDGLTLPVIFENYLKIARAFKGECNFQIPRVV